MTRDRKILYSVSASLFVILLLLLTLPISGSRYIAAILLPLAAVAVPFLIKKRPIYSIFKKQVLMIMALSGVLYVIVYYLTGLKFGFSRSLAVGLITVFRYILPIVLIIVSTEIIRAVLVAQRSKFASVFCYLFCVAAEVIALGDKDEILTVNLLVDSVAVALLPAIIVNLLFSYLSRRYGMLPNIVYRLTTALYLYIFKYVPALPGAIFSFAKLVIPILLLVFIDSLYEKKIKYALKRKSKLLYPSLALIAAFMVCVVMLISCQFRFGILVIGSESMSGEIEKGDAVIFERFEGQNIETGEVIIFESDGRLVVHRVVDVQKVNSQKLYFTKGDANENVDIGYVTESNITGVCHFKIPYIGYPSLWLRTMLKF